MPPKVRGQNLTQIPADSLSIANKKSAPQATPMLVLGGYCQHTEGFGEMAEEENR